MKYNSYFNKEKLSEVRVQRMIIFFQLILYTLISEKDIDIEMLFKR